MNRIGAILLNVSVALYLFANGVVGITKEKILGITISGGEFGKMVDTIFKNANSDFKNVLVIILAVFAIAAGVFLLLALFRIEVPITDLILLVFICLWVVFIVIVDIINPIQSNRDITFLKYLLQITPHLMVLGAIVSATKRFGNS